MTTATAKKATTRKTTASTAKPKPAPAKSAPTAEPVKDQPMTRPAAVARLRELGYTGPVSYDMGTLRAMVGWAEAGMPKDAPVPASVLHAAHPELKPSKAARTKRLSAGYLAACADVLALLDSNGDVRELVTQALANGEAAA